MLNDKQERVKIGNKIVVMILGNTIILHVAFGAIQYSQSMETGRITIISN